MPDPISNSPAATASYDFAEPTQTQQQCPLHGPQPESAALSPAIASLTSQVPSGSTAFVANQSSRLDNDRAEACIDAGISAVITCGLTSVTPGGALIQFLAGAACGASLIDVQRQCFEE